MRFAAVVRSGGIVLFGLALGALGAGCAHEAKPPEPPSEPPPLPPASGSPISFLVDASELQLTDNQRTQLQEIDSNLGARLATLDAQSHTPDPVTVSAPKARGLGFEAGAAGASNSRGNGMQAGGRGMSTLPNPPPTAAEPTETRSYTITSESLTQISVQRMRDTRDAIRKALSLLDPRQRELARQLLIDHGVNPDTGQTGGDPGAQQP